PHARSGPDTCTRTVGLADHLDRPRHGLPAEHVDAEPSGSMPDAATPRRSAASVMAHSTRRNRRPDAVFEAAVVKSHATGPSCCSMMAGRHSGTGASWAQPSWTTARVVLVPVPRGCDGLPDGVWHHQRGDQGRSHTMT